MFCLLVLLCEMNSIQCVWSDTTKQRSCIGQIPCIFDSYLSNLFFRVSCTKPLAKPTAMF